MVGTIVAVAYSTIDRSLKGSRNSSWMRCGERLAKDAIDNQGFREMQALHKEQDRFFVSELTIRVRDTIGPCVPEVGQLKPKPKELAAFAKGFEKVVGKNY